MSGVVAIGYECQTCSEPMNWLPWAWVAVALIAIATLAVLFVWRYRRAE